MKMQKMSRERIQALARAIVDDLSESPAAKFLKSRETVRQTIVQTLLEEQKQDEEREAAVLAQMADMAELPPVGSREWNALFRRLLKEQYDRV